MTKIRIDLRQLSLYFFIIVSLSLKAQEGGESDEDKKSDLKAKTKSKLSADIYEKEDTTLSFSAPVKLIRDSDVVEVFFEGKYKGPYILKNDPNIGVFKERLIKSQKNKKQSVSVKVVDDVITGVELIEQKTTEKKKDDMDSVLDDILKK